MIIPWKYSFALSDHWIYFSWMYYKVPFEHLYCRLKEDSCTFSVRACYATPENSQKPSKNASIAVLFSRFTLLLMCFARGTSTIENVPSSGQTLKCRYIPLLDFPWNYSTTPLFYFTAFSIFSSFFIELKCN